MRQGRSIENTTMDLIYSFLLNNKQAGFEKIYEHCRKENEISRGTVKKYLDEMKKMNDVEQSPDGRHPYSLTQKGSQIAEKRIISKAVGKFLDESDPREIKQWLGILKKYGMRFGFRDNLPVIDKKSGQVLGIATGLVTYVEREKAIEVQKWLKS